MEPPLVSNSFLYSALSAIAVPDRPEIREGFWEAHLSEDAGSGPWAGFSG
jgi:hypothetical protein